VSSIRPVSCFLHPAKQHAHLIIALLDQAHIGGHDFVSDLVARKGLADRVVHEGFIDGMRVVPLLGITHRRQDLVVAVHRVIGGGHDIGPVRFDVGQVTEPGIVAGLLHECHAAPGHIGCLGVVFLDVRGFVRMLHEPAGRHLPLVVDAGIGEVMPGIFRAVALAPQIVIVVFGAARIIRTVRPLRPHTVIPLEHIETTFSDTGANDRGRVQAQPGHAGGIRAHVGFADEEAVHAERAEMITKRHLTDLQRKAVPGGTM